MSAISVWTTAAVHAQQAQQDGQVEREPVVAQEEHRQVVERFDRLQEELDETIAREVFNHLRSNPHMQRAREQILDGTPMPPQLLQGAVAYFQGQGDIAERSRNWPEAAHVKAIRTDADLQIDGKLDEEDWNKAHEVLIGYLPNQVERRAVAPAAARLMWDDRYIYIAYVVLTETIEAPELPRDAAVYMHDCIELFLMPDPAIGLYWEIVVSPSGSIFDALCFWNRDAWISSMRVDLDVAGMQVGTMEMQEVEVDGTRGPGYVVELAIPWGSLPAAPCEPTAGTTMKGLLALSLVSQVEDRRRHQFLSHTPMLATFHNIHTMGTIELVD